LVCVWYDVCVCVWWVRVWCVCVCGVCVWCVCVLCVCVCVCVCVRALAIFLSLQCHVLCILSNILFIFLMAGTLFIIDLSDQ